MATLLQQAGPVLMPLLATALCRTLRFTVTNAPPAGAGPMVVAFWHGAMFAPWWLHRHSGAVGLVSGSKDGVVLARVLEAWGYRAIRGSSTSGGPEALGEMTAAVAGGRTLLITPDGPRGPRRVMKRGAALVAQRTGRPLVLLGIRYVLARELWGWDRFAVPYPMSMVRATYSDPIHIPPDLSGPGFDALVRDLGGRLDALTTFDAGETPREAANEAAPRSGGSSHAYAVGSEGSQPEATPRLARPSPRR